MASVRDFLCQARSARLIAATMLCASVATIARPALALRGIQLSPDGKRVLVNKDVNDERWAIVLNQDDGTVTGNVFFRNGQDPAFIFCQPLNDPNSFTCFGAGSCTTDNCVDQYVPLGDVTMPSDFFQATSAPPPSGLTLLGVFQEVEENFAPAADILPTVDDHPSDTTRIVDITRIDAIPNDVNGDGDADGGFLGMENNLSSKSINVEGVNVKIVVPGAVTNPVATDFVPLGIRLGPAVVAFGQTATNEAFARRSSCSRVSLPS
jgi:hypothetical protein